MKKKDGSFVPNGNEPIAEITTNRSKPREALERHHSELVELFGENYEEDPRFQEAVSAVEKGRSPRLVLADYADDTAPSDRFMDGPGWAW